MISGAILSRTLLTAVRTPLPRYRFLSPSLSSSISCSPVDAPEGTEARPVIPDRSVTSASTVGLPRESRISLALMLMISVMSASSWLEYAYRKRKDRTSAAVHDRRRGDTCTTNEADFQGIIGV